MKSEKEAEGKSATLAPSRTAPRPGSSAPAPTSDPAQPGPQQSLKPPFRPIPGEGTPEIPGSEKSPDSSTGSPDGDGVLIDDEIAGELANAVPTLVNIFEPAWEVMNQSQMLKIGRALRIYLERKGKTTLDHPELLLFVAGYGYLSQQFKNVRKAAAERKVKGHAANDRRPEGDGKDVPSVVGREENPRGSDVHS